MINYDQFLFFFYLNGITIRRIGAQMMTRPNVSIIVPVFNEFPYLRRCIDSLKAQTMKEFEIIFVDDGSTDGCGALLDRAAADDARFSVIHQTNRGLSSARNHGIAAARAPYILFVDADDTVRNDFCELAYNSISSLDADIVLFGHYEVDFSGRTKAVRLSRTASEGIISRDEALRLICGTPGTMACDKIYHRDVFRKVSFPDGHVFEDVSTIYRIILNASVIGYLDQPLYFHHFTKGSISFTWTIENAVDKFDARMKRALRLHSLGFDEKIVSDEFITAAYLYVKMVPHSDFDKRMLVSEKILKNVHRLPASFSRKQHLIFLIYKKCRPLFDIAYTRGKRNR